MEAKLNEGKETILITGGTGLVGKKLSDLLSGSGYNIIHLSRGKKKGKYPTYRWDLKNKEIDLEALEIADYIIHLAGAGVADKKWSNSWKQEIISSRIDSTFLLNDAINNNGMEIKHFISASAIGYYGIDSGDELVDESSAIGKGFLAGVVRDWECEVRRFEKLNIKTSIVRIGIVLDKEGGALEKMIQPVKLGVGAPLASGNQYMSWTHVDDLCKIFEFIIKEGHTGIYNGVAPNPVMNKDFTKTLGKILKKPVFLPNVPSFALKMMFGEMASILIGGNNVSSKKIEDLGFNFQYPILEEALENLLNDG